MGYKCSIHIFAHLLHVPVVVAFVHVSIWLCFIPCQVKCSSSWLYRKNTHVSFNGH